MTATHCRCWSCAVIRIGLTMFVVGQIIALFAGYFAAAGGKP